MEIKVSTDLKLEEDICCFPSGTFPLLFEEGELGSSLYLHVLKAEWFRLFDCIAELQHDVTVQQQRNADHLAHHHYQALKQELQTFLWPKTPLLLSDVEESSVKSKAHDQDEDIEGEELEEEGHDHDREEGGGDQDEHEPIAKDAVSLPRAGKVWRGGPPSLKYGYGQIYVPDDCLKGCVTKSRNRTFVPRSDAEEFRKMWCRKNSSKKDQPVACRDQEAMNKFVENRFLY
jgi:hypothetical protein